MTYAAWPSIFPKPKRDGYQSTVADGRLSTSNSIGPKRIRRRTSATPRPLTMDFQLTAQQLARFKGFWNDDAAEGSLPFTMPDYEVDGWPLYDNLGDPVESDAGVQLTGSASLLVMFATEQPAVWVPSGNGWRLTINVVVMP